MNVGKIVSVKGSAVDIEFPDVLPAIYTLLRKSYLFLLGENPGRMPESAGEEPSDKLKDNTPVD